MIGTAKKTVVKYGHQAPKGRRENNLFGYIHVKDMHYCASHDFWFDKELHEKMLHYAMPCIYTDYRYLEGRNNYFKEGYMLRLPRTATMPLKAAMRYIRKTRNLPVGTIVTIGSHFYGVGRKGKSINFSYLYKVKKENYFDPKYEISPQLNEKNFNTDDKARDLVDLLRTNGFIVRVNSKNTNFISGLISTAAAAKGRNIEPSDEEGEIATAWGHGLKIGFSSNDSTYRGYSYGVKSILFDRWNYFDKWSRCREISKEKSNQEILEILLKAGSKFDDPEEED